MSFCQQSFYSVAFCQQSFYLVAFCQLSFLFSVVLLSVILQSIILLSDILLIDILFSGILPSVILLSVIRFSVESFGQQLSDIRPTIILTIYFLSSVVLYCVIMLKGMAWRLTLLVSILIINIGLLPLSVVANAGAYHQLSLSVFF